MLHTTNKQFEWLYAAIVFLWVFYAIWPSPLFSGDTTILADSWTIAINLSVSKQRAFGEDFVFTYGPFGYLSTRLPNQLNSIFIVIFYLFICTGVALVAVKMLNEQRHWVNKILVPICFGLAGLALEFDVVSVMLMLSFYCVIQYTRTAKPYFGYFVAILALFDFFMRPNTGLISFLVFIATVLLAFFYKKQRKHALLILAVYAAGVLLTISWLPFNFFDYVKFGYIVTCDFNDAMFYEIRNDLELWIAMVIVLLTVASLWVFYRHEKRNFWTSLGYVLIPLGILLTLFKKGYTRADAHQVIFLSLAPVFAMIYMSLSRKHFVKLQFLLLLLMSSLSVYSIHYYRNPFAFSGITINEKSNDSELEVFKLPADIKNEVSNETIDFLPGEISIPYFNKLNYRGRPVPQSYQAYSEELDDLNAAFIQSSKAPEWMAIRNRSIDLRHPGWDENKTKMAIQSRYEYQKSFNMAFDSVNDFILLRQRTHMKHWKTDWSKKINLALGDTLFLPRYAGVQWMQANVKYQLANKIRRFVYHPRFATITMGYNDGSTSTHPIIKPILESGVILSPRLLTNEDALAFYGDQQNEWHYPVWILIEGNTIWIDPSVDIEIKGLKQEQ